MSPVAFLALFSTVVAVVALALLARRSVQQGLEGRGMEVDEDQLHEIFESSDEAAALASGDGTIVRANGAFYHLFGYAPDLVPGMRLDSLLPTGIEGADPLEAVEAAASGRSTSFDAVARKQDGAAIEVSIMVGPVRRGERDAVAFVIFRDDGRKVLIESAFRRLEKALDTMQLGVTITDLNGRIVYTNPAEAKMHGWTAEELIGREASIFGLREDQHRLDTEEIADVGTWRRESVNVRRDGTRFHAQLLSDVVRGPDGRPMGIVTTCEDITRRKVAERALRESEERYALAMRGANDGLWDWNMRTGDVFFSDRWREMLGLEETDVPRSLDAWLLRVHPEDRDALRSDLMAHRDDESTRFENEHRVAHADGSWRWVAARGIVERDPDGHPYRIAGALTDITERKNQEAQLTQDALYDPLTGLPNRAFLDSLLARSIGRLKRRSDYRFAILFLDLDRFKKVNDTLGHQAGDKLLVEVARRLEQSVRPGDVVIRISGDEFCVLLDEINQEKDTTRVARRILERLDEPIRIDGRPILTGCSIGIAISEPELTDPEEILRNADAAMYRAKGAGRARFELFDRSMQEEALATMRLENDLREGIEEDQFHLVYQPIVRLTDRRIIGVEALVRWHHPERGLLPPSKFVPLAEETGLIVPLGRWILREACRQMGDWTATVPDLEEMSVSVNLSTRQLRHPELVDDVREALDFGDLDPSRLRLEISEGTLMEDPEWNRDVLGTLRAMGVQVQVDDFGTGTSSLSYLNQFSVSTLKIDRSFISEVGEPTDRTAVVQAIITMARQLGLRVVAEGVETDAHSARLQSLDCEEGQGYLFHQPLEADAVAPILLAQPRDVDPGDPLDA